mmetsp:Transcript_26559/g.76236  ORF Transcript_26559/g.76236 Transcript_26559/m.76236 type:complete len:231 (+) Transcript_26559:1056-1748(+)
MNSMPMSVPAEQVPWTAGPPDMSSSQEQRAKRWGSVRSATLKSQRSKDSRLRPCSSIRSKPSSICSAADETISCTAGTRPEWPAVKSCSRARWSSSSCSKSSMGILLAVISLSAVSFFSTLAMSLVSSSKSVALRRERRSSSSSSAPRTIFFTELKIWPAMDCTTLSSLSSGTSTILETECVTRDAPENMIRMIAVISRQLQMDSVRRGSVKLNKIWAWLTPSSPFCSTW